MLAEELVVKCNITDNLVDIMLQNSFIEERIVVSAIMYSAIAAN